MKKKATCPKCKSTNVEVKGWAMIVVTHDFTCKKCGHKWQIVDDY